MKLRLSLCLLPLAFSGYLCAQTASDFDNTGDPLLVGTYSFRQTLYTPDYTSDNYGTITRSVAMYGSISFDGNGNYSIAGSEIDSTGTGTPQNVSLTGTYTIAASGSGYMDNPITGSDSIYGAVAQGIFIGSSTESAFNDLFIAAPVGSPAASTATLNGSYYVTELDFPTTDPGLARDALYQLTADGAGNLADFSFSGYVANSTNLITQSVTGSFYNLSGGVGTLAFPTGSLSSSILVQGNKQFDVTPDGNFLFGGAVDGYDMLVGVRASSGAVDNSYFSGLYYQVGLDLDSSQIASQTNYLDTYYGSLNAFTGTFLGHERLNYLTTSNAFDYTFDDTYNLSSTGSYSSGSGVDYIVGDGGLVRIGSGGASFVGLNVSVGAPTFTGSGVFLNPTGVVNSASSAPFTAGVAPGEFVTLYGSGLAPGVLSDTDIPIDTTLNGVQVLVDGIPAPVFFVSPTQINIAVPYGVPSTPTPVVSFQVINNGSSSNIVTEFLNSTAAGVFTSAGDGIGSGAVQHLDYAPVTDADPAVVGETLIAYAAGLGDVVNDVTDGVASPGNLTSNDFFVYVDGTQATTTYVGLSGYASLYQINFVVPAVSDTGDVYLEISGVDSDTSQATLAVTAASADSVRKTKRSRPRHLPSVVHRGTRTLVDKRMSVKQK